MATQTQNPKFKIKQFQWFEMETKVRQIIQQILGPLQKRILENSSILNKVKFNQSEDQRKIQEITLMIANDPKVFENGIFLTVDKKFEQQSKRIQELARQITEENKYVDQKFNILDIRMQQSSQVLQNVAAMRQRVAKEMQLQNQNINSVRTNLEKMIEDLNSDIRQTRQTVQKNLQICQKADYNLGEKISHAELKIAHIQDTLKNHHELHRQESCKLQQHSEKLKKHHQQIDALQQSKALTKKLCDYIKDLENQIKKYDFKLTTLSPLITEAQISDCLFNVLPQKMKKRIAIHEYKKYHSLNRQVLQKDFNTITDRFHGLQLLQAMQKRSTRQIVQMKRKKLLSMGVDIDHLTYQQRQRYYNDMVLEDAVDDDDEQVRVAAKVDQKQVVQIINKHYKTLITKMSEKIGIELDDSKKYIYDLQSELRHQISKFQQKFQKIQRINETYQAEQILQNKNFQHEMKTIEKNIEISAVEIQGLKQIQKSLYNFCSLVNHLQIQDEIDKQNISLMGLQENSAESNIMGNSSNIHSGTQYKAKNSILQLQKKCFSCCGFPATTISAFKMACLAYSPSEIIIDSVQYKRQELLEFTTNVLQAVKKMLQPKQRISSQQQQQQVRPQTSQFPRQQYQQGLISRQQQPSLKTTQNYGRKISTCSNKFRSSKKMTQTYNNKSISRSTKRHSIREDMLNASNAFNQLRKRNMNFLI